MTNNMDTVEEESVEELKKKIASLEGKLHKYDLLTQSTILKLKETGLDLQLIGRNMDRLLQELSD